MKHVYTVHTKMIQDKTHYFVKKLMLFSEFEGLANVVIGYGMHTNFEKACRIAGLHDSERRKQLFLEVAQNNPAILPERQVARQSIITKKQTAARRSVQLIDTVNRWLAERGVAVFN